MLFIAVLIKKYHQNEEHSGGNPGWDSNPRSSYLLLRYSTNQGEVPPCSPKEKKYMGL